jgi:hypothetical protein
MSHTHPLANIIQAFLTERHGALYATEKVADLKDMSYADILAWAVVYLDPSNQRTLAIKIGVDPDSMRVLRRVFDAARRAGNQES